ncbi:unnamed protein product [Paramecium octaurelia]|uniref:Tetratricopeptide repeat protein n=1 Tax=Paramecium octaurelia TaxID=43137 RepID=A0A8S1U358_PAROT|nr:unnamed protein product [Paramecium octaurelia]
MELFRCKYLSHENEEILGFCLNQDCQNTTQFCFECLNKHHTQHFNDCIRFTKIVQFINEFIQEKNQSKKQIQEISKQFQNQFEQITKTIDQDIKILENMNQQLQNQDYQTFKQQIHIIKHYYSKEKENFLQQQIFQLNNILETIKIEETKQNQVVDQIYPAQKKDSKKEESNQVNKDQERSLIFNFEEIFDTGVALQNLQKYQESIESFDKAISINPQNDRVWNHKGSALHDLQKFKEAIECYEKAILINPKNDIAWSNKGSALHCLQKYEEAIDCYEKVFLINPNNDTAWSKKGSALHSLEKYEEAIYCQEKVISINPKNDIAWTNKGSALHCLQKFQDAIAIIKRNFELLASLNYINYQK